MASRSVVNDLAEAHVKAIKKLNSCEHIITNLATGNSYSVLDVVNKTIEVTKKQLNFEFINRREGDPGSLYAKSSNILDYENKYSALKNIIQTTWNIYK